MQEQFLVLPALLQTALLALLSTSITLSVTFTSTLIAAFSDGRCTPNPSRSELEEATSMHAMAFSLHGDLLVDESEGTFDMDVWDRVYDCGKGVCCSSTAISDGSQAVSPTTANGHHLEAFLRMTLQEKTALDQTWKGH